MWSAGRGGVAEVFAVHVSPCVVFFGRFRWGGRGGGGGVGVGLGRAEAPAGGVGRRVSPVVFAPFVPGGGGVLVLGGGGGGAPPGGFVVVISLA